MLFSLCLLLAGRASAQWVVTDPTNLAQGIVNTTKQIIQTSSTASNMIKNFQETVKIYEQGKNTTTVRPYRRYNKYSIGKLLGKCSNIYLSSPAYLPTKGRQGV